MVLPDGYDRFTAAKKQEVLWKQCEATKYTTPEQIAANNTDASGFESLQIMVPCACPCSVFIWGCLLLKQPVLAEEVVRAARQAVLLLHTFVGQEAACPVRWPNQH